MFKLHRDSHKLTRSIHDLAAPWRRKTFPSSVGMPISMDTSMSSGKASGHLSENLMRHPSSELAAEQQADYIADQFLILQQSPHVVDIVRQGRGQADSGLKELNLRSIKTRVIPETSNPIIRKGLASPGQKLDRRSRSYYESHLGFDLGQIHLHTDTPAEESAKHINAAAYTLNNHIAFNKGRYRPDTTRGRHLLAHEITHAIQQTFNPPLVQKVDGDDESDQALNSLLPGYSQEGDTCGATSLVTALVIWDRENSAQSNDLILDLLNIVQTWMIHHRTRTIDDWNNNGFNGQGIYDEATESMDDMRDHLTNTDVRLSEQEYQMIGIILYALYVDRSSGLSSSDIWNLQTRLGLETNLQSNRLISYSNLFTDPIIVGLDPGQIAQVGWVVRTGEPNGEGQVPIGHHAFLIGRFQSGEWFLSDQGPNPAAEFVADSLLLLSTDVTEAARNGRYWIYTGSIEHVIGWTGIRLLAGPESVREEARSLIANGTLLAEIDVGAFTIGDSVTSGDFVATAYNLGDANLAAGSVGINHGAVIVEIPRGVFHVYETNLIRSANIQATEIDQSGGGLLTRHIYYSARLVICDGNACNIIEAY